MELYVFLKTMLIRNIIFRIVDDDTAGVSSYRCIAYFYRQISKATEEATEDEKTELNAISKLFEEEHFITLLILKLDSTDILRNSYITDFLCQICPKSS